MSIARTGSGFFGAKDIVARPLVEAMAIAYARGEVSSSELQVEVCVGDSRNAIYQISAIQAFDERDRGSRVIAAGEVRDEAGSYHHFILHCYRADDLEDCSQPLRGCFNVM